MSLDGPLQLHVQICHLQLVLDNLLGKIKMICIFDYSTISDKKIRNVSIVSYFQ